MENKYITGLLSVALIVLLGLLADPFMYWMPTMAQMAVLLLAVIGACVWVGFVAYERASDERETMLRMHAGRMAYLAGFGVLILAVIVQGLAHHIDPWILGALGAMVAGKMLARFRG